MNNLVKKTLHGYTLIEILVALFIFSILVVVVSQALNQILINQENLSEKEEELLKLQKAFAIIAQDVRLMVAKKEFDINRKLEPGFSYRENQLSFYRMGYINPEYQFERSSLQKVTYALKDNTLFRQLKKDDEVNILTFKILENVDKLTWTFFGPSGDRYTIWPPVQEWAFDIPVGVTVAIEHKNYGKIQRSFSLASELL